MQPMRRASGETVMVSTGRRMGSYADLLAPPIDPHSARAGGTPLHDRDFRPRRRTLVRGGSTDSSLWRQSGPVEEADSTNDLNTFENGRGDSPIGESTPRSQRYDYTHSDSYRCAKIVDFFDLLKVLGFGPTYFCRLDD